MADLEEDKIIEGISQQVEEEFFGEFIPSVPPATKMPNFALAIGLGIGV
jgi:hypothetical protein